MLWLTHILSTPSSIATLAPRLACPYHVFCLSDTTNKNRKSDLATQDSWHRRWPILIMFYLVVHHHWIYPRNILWKIHFIQFSDPMCIYLLLLWCCHMVWCMRVSLSILLQVSLLALTSFDNLALWLAWMVPFHFKDHETRWSNYTELFSHLKYLSGAIKWWWLSILHIFSKIIERQKMVARKH